jgi:sirohydrochlorin cobaltochelatase
MSETLLLIGHGSSRYPDAAQAMRRHADSLRSGGHFGQVEVAVLNGGPTVADALARSTSRAIRVVPFFMEDGYFTRIAVPRALGAANGNNRIVICPPIGVHDGMAGLIERRALTACADDGVPSHTTAVVVVGHGSVREPGRALALHRHTARVASTTLFNRVEAACIEEAPFVADTLASLRAHPVVVIGFFANHGSHFRDDLPALIAAEQAASQRPIRLRGSVADGAEVAQIILAQSRAVAPP